MTASPEVPRGAAVDAVHSGSRRWGRVSVDGAPAVRAAQGQDEAELREAALERLRGQQADGKPHRRAILSKRADGQSVSFEDVDVKRLSKSERSRLVVSALATPDPDYEPLLKNYTQRLSRVGLQLSSVEVRFENLEVETDVHVGSRGLPSVPNALLDYALAPLSALGLRLGRRQVMPVLKSCCGILHPGQLTLLLGPPGSGKSTLLKVLSGKLDTATLRMKGDISYNGHSLDKFVVQRTAAYVEQRDNHIADLTVRETLDFAACCQGAGSKPLELRQLQALEQEAGVAPGDPDLDAFFKAEAVVGGRHSVATELYLRLLGLGHVADTLVGGSMQRGISGGQRKRVTTGEMIVGPKTTLFCDEITTGLDSSTAFQIVSCIRDFVHFRQATILMSLLAPPPEIFALFDSIMFMSEGRIVFHGNREEVMPFFESMGFALPERKGIADFLQEVTSEQEQHLYWADGDGSRPYVTVPEFVAAFQMTAAARRTAQQLTMPYDPAASPPGALVKQRYGLPWHKALSAMMWRELTLTSRNRFTFLFQSCQIMLNALLVAALFFRTTRSPTSLTEAELYLGVLFFSLNAMLFNQWAEFSIIVEQLPVFFKQRDNLFFRAWQFLLPRQVLSVPQAIIEALVWSSLTYWLVGLSPEASRFCTYWLVNTLMHLNSVALFRLLGAISRTMAYATAMSVIVTLVLLQLGGFVIPKSNIGGWWIWVYWISPLSWGTQALAINEFRAARWQVPLDREPDITHGDRLLQIYAFHTSQAWIWAGVAFMVASLIVINALIVAALTFFSAPSEKGGTVSEELLAQKRAAVADATADAAHGTAANGTKQQSASEQQGKSDGKHVVVDMQQLAHAAAPGSSAPNSTQLTLPLAPASSMSLVADGSSHGGHQFAAVSTPTADVAARQQMTETGGAKRQQPAEQQRSGSGGDAAHRWIAARIREQQRDGSSHGSRSSKSVDTSRSVRGHSMQRNSSAHLWLADKAAEQRDFSTHGGSKRQLQPDGSVRNGSVHCGGSRRSNGVHPSSRRRLQSGSLHRMRQRQTGGLAFEQLCLTFKHVWYSVDLPRGQTVEPNPKREATSGRRQLYLLNDISGAFRPNVLTALMGASGAGKTTLMDVLAGRKTAGRVEGDISVQGHPKVQSTFARMCGYVEQEDVHSPQTTVLEALLFSATLRLNAHHGRSTVTAFVQSAMDIVELADLSHALVGLPGRSGLSVEQRKRLTIAVELVANPSIVFMDEPTSGLDARAAAIVMRAVRNTVDTGRTVVCTIHQPAHDVFESFDELLLLKRGGRCIYSGPLGERSADLINYFQGFDGVPGIEPDTNPATWMLEVTTESVERNTGTDFADAYEGRPLYRQTLSTIEELSVPPEGHQPLHFSSRHPRNTWQQFRACLWKNSAIWWRSTDYNAVRIVSTVVLSVAIGSAFWGAGTRSDTRQDVLAIAGSAYTTAISLGVYNACAIQPVVAVERPVFARERHSGMYGVLPYALAQLIIEIPWLVAEAVVCSAISYGLMQLRWTATKFLWFLWFQFLTLAYMTVYGIASVALTPNERVAAVISGSVFFLMELFCGFIISGPAMPIYIRWLYYANPMSWTVNGITASQLGDITDQYITEDDGSRVTVKDFVRHEFDFRYDQLGVVSAVLIAFTVALAAATVLALRFLNYMKR